MASMSAILIQSKIQKKWKAWKRLKRLLNQCYQLSQSFAHAILDLILHAVETSNNTLRHGGLHGHSWRARSQSCSLANYTFGFCGGRRCWRSDVDHVPERVSSVLTC